MVTVLVVAESSAETTRVDTLLPSVVALVGELLATGALIEVSGIGEAVANEARRRATVPKMVVKCILSLLMG